MKQKALWYSFFVHARAQDEIDPVRRYEKLINAIKSLPPPWGQPDKEVPRLVLDENWATFISFTQYFGVKWASLRLDHRRDMRDDRCSDDFLGIKFNSSKIDFDLFIRKVAPALIEAMGAYHAELYTPEMMDLDFDELQNNPPPNYNWRFYVHKIDLIKFIDATLCKRGLGMSPTELAERFTGQVPIVRRFANGVYLVASEKPLPFEEAEALRLRLTALAKRRP